MNNIEDNIPASSDINNPDNQNKKQKKRGRPKKIVVPDKNNKSKQSNKSIEDDEIVLRLPITINDITKYSKEQEIINTNIISSNSNSSNIKVSDIFTITELTNHDQELEQDQDHPINLESSDDLDHDPDLDIDINPDLDSDQDISLTSMSSSSKAGSKKMRILEKTIHKQREQIKKLKDDLRKINDARNDFNYMNSKKITKIDLGLINIIDGEQVITESTNVACWWDTEHFDNPPCFLTEDLIDGVYHVFGCFCSFNCAAAFNENIGDYKVSHRFSILLDLYEKTQNIQDSNYTITIAPKPLVLTKFGGNKTIQEFRTNFLTTNREIRYIMPPMKPIMPYIEEIDTFRRIINTSTNSSSNDHLVLKRTKPLLNNKRDVLSNLTNN